MSNPTGWLPLRWRSGPLETALDAAVTAETRAINEAWQKPELLAKLAGAAANCIVVTWAAGRPEDAEQQKALRPVIAKAHELGMAVVGAISGPAEAAILSAREAKLDAVLVDGGAAPVPGILVISSTAANKVRSGTAPVIALSGAGWPSIQTRRGASSERRALVSGPTGTPWVDSNGWRCELADAKAPGKTIWISATPPADAGVLRDEAFMLAAADAAMYGARWIVDLDASRRKGLASGDAESFAVLKKIGTATRFFEGRKDWRDYKPVARLAVMSDFDGPNEYVASEVMNLLNRRPEPFRAIDIANLTAKSLDGIKGVLWIDQKAPDTKFHELLGGFVKSGGLFIGSPSVAHLTQSMQSAGNYDNRYELFSHGEGRIAVARKPWTDPYMLATDAHMLLGRRNDVVRLWNAGTTNVHYTAGNGKGLVQVVNFAMRHFGHPMSLYVAHPYKSARLIALEGGGPEELTITSKSDGVEVNLPPFAIYSAVEFGD